MQRAHTPSLSSGSKGGPIKGVIISGSRDEPACVSARSGVIGGTLAGGVVISGVLCGLLSERPAAASRFRAAWIRVRVRVTVGARVSVR